MSKEDKDLTFGELTKGDRFMWSSGMNWNEKDNLYSYTKTGDASVRYNHPAYPSSQSVPNPTREVFRVKINMDTGKIIMPPAYEHIPVEHWGKGEIKLKLHWTAYGKRVSWQGAKLTIQDAQGTRTTKRFVVTLDEGEWPSERHLMMICDGRVPTDEGHPGNFGGGASFLGKQASVSVYID